MELNSIAAAKISTVKLKWNKETFPISSGFVELASIVLIGGPGYRVYIGREGDILIVLLDGGTKREQQQDKNGLLHFKNRGAKQKGLTNSRL